VLPHRLRVRISGLGLHPSPESWRRRTRGRKRVLAGPPRPPGRAFLRRDPTLPSADGGCVAVRRGASARPTSAVAGTRDRSPWPRRRGRRPVRTFHPRRQVRAVHVDASLIIDPSGLGRGPLRKGGSKGSGGADPGAGPDRLGPVLTGWFRVMQTPRGRSGAVRRGHLTALSANPTVQASAWFDLVRWTWRRT
jgi:hypothetical protein